MSPFFNKNRVVVFFLVFASFIFVNRATAGDIYIPHITGGASGWTDYLQIDNTGSSSAEFTITLYSDGTAVYSQPHTVSAYDHELMDLKSLAATAETGIVTYSGTGLTFRLSYMHTAGGVAEFALSDTLHSSLGLFFSDFIPDIASKGAAVANMSSSTASVTLYAIGAGDVLGTYETSLPPFQKLVADYSTWFPLVNFSDIDSIIAVSAATNLTGLTICSNTDLSWLLFTPGQPVSGFEGGGGTSATVSVTADHTSAAAFSSIPEGYFSSSRAAYTIYYGHTSHGSQIIEGLTMLENENPSRYQQPDIYDYSGRDLGDATWETDTKDHLDSTPSTNMVMWSWCGQLSWYTEAQVDAYLDTMDTLETLYPDVTFVYMTGHLDGTGPAGTLHENNNLIRAYCSDNNKVLFDFADIESYSPDGEYYPDGSDACEWCDDWCSEHSCPSLGCESGDCQHSNCFNCYLKGKAFWWMMARLAGWSDG